MLLFGGASEVVTAAPESDEEAETEPYRPEYHFSPTSGWMNDPNGMVYHDGRYHLFYQAGKDRRRWDHAVSDDLVTWEEWGTEILDDGIQAYSGGAAVDGANTAGFGPDALVATFTGHHDDGLEDQRLAFSVNGGRTVDRSEHNPVIESDVGDFRDPNPVWYEPDRNWRLLVARVSGTADRPAGIEIYESDDLHEWTYLNTYGSGGANWECPSLYELPVAGSDETRWVLTVSVEWNHVEHHVGRFDGTTFQVDRRLRADHGFDFYGAQSWANTPSRPGLQLAWMNNWVYAHGVPGSGWQGAQTLPRTVSLVTGDDGVELRQRIPPEVTRLRSRKLTTLHHERIAPDTDPVSATPAAGDTIELFAKIRPRDADSVGLAVRESSAQRTLVTFDVPNEELIVDRGEADALFSPDGFAIETGPLPLLDDGTIELRLLVDRCSLEVFANDGRYTNTNLIFPDPESTGVSSFARGGSAELLEFVAYDLAA